MQNPRAVVIGYGKAGRNFHSYLIHITPNLDLYGVYARRAEVREQVVAEYGCHVYAEFDAVLADPNVDLIVIATSTEAHAELAIQAMEAGKDVVTDKPIADNLADCDRMIEASQRTGRMLNVFQNRRWDGDFLTIKQLMAEGRLGDMRWVEVAWMRYGPPLGWRGHQGRGGGRLLDLGTHMLDQLLLLIPHEITSVYARLRYEFPTHNVESHCLIILNFANGATALCDISAMVAYEKPRFLVAGSQATFHKFGVDPQEVWMSAQDIDGANEEEALYGRLNDGQKEEVIPTLNGRWRSYYENVGDILTKGAEPAVKLAEVRRVMAVVDAVWRSAETDRVIDVKI